MNIFDFCPTKSSLKKSLGKNWIRVNDHPASTATFLYGGEKIELIVPETERDDVELDIRLRVLYEDDDIAAVEKPPGIPTSGAKKRTLANALWSNVEKSSKHDATRPFPVHRLDYETSGVVLIGKSNTAIRALSELFASREVRKTYFAITIGEMPLIGEINNPLHDKSAYTRYEVQQSVESAKFGWLNLVKLIPETGRRNQLRRHMKSIGSPILGDKKYGREGLILTGKGLYLHAYSLEFIHPFFQERIEVLSTLPKKFGKIFPSPEKSK